MIKTVFYSWQSDLPIGTNRNYIEACINEAISKINRNDDYIVDLNLDRDTKGIAGTPDIVNSIFKKIDKCDIFIADISIINKLSEGRKTPNPNVLLELGYASKVLGWDKIICLFNTSYGRIEELPFNLRFRRPFAYSIDKANKNKSRKSFVDYLTKAINDIAQHLTCTGKVSPDIKYNIDGHLFTIIRQLIDFCYDYDERNASILEIYEFLKLAKVQLAEIIKNRIFLGFQILKKWDEGESEIHELFGKPLYIKTLDEETASVVVNILLRMKGMQSLSQDASIFEQQKEKAIKYKAVNGLELNPRNVEYPNRFLLLRHIKDDQYVVQEFGDFDMKDRDKLLNYYRVKPEYIIPCSDVVHKLTQEISKWIKLTGPVFSIPSFSETPIVFGKVCGTPFDGGAN